MFLMPGLGAWVLDWTKQPLPAQDNFPKMGKSKKSKKDKKDRGRQDELMDRQPQALVPGQLMVANEQVQLVPYSPPATQPQV